ncbi:MAG: response regulator [bacterium]
MIKIFIAGGNVVCNALISMLKEEVYAGVVGVFEKRHDAPGALLARELQIPVFDQLQDITSVNPEIIVNLTGNPLITREVRESYGGIEVIEGAGAQFLLETIERLKRLRVDSKKAVEDQRALFEFSRKIQTVQQQEYLFDSALDIGMEISGCPGAFIAVIRNHDVQIVTHKGLSKKLLNAAMQQSTPDSIFGQHLKDGDIVEVRDVIKESHLKEDQVFLSERLRAFIVSPLAISGEIKCLLFLGDYKPRTFSRRTKVSVALLLSLVETALHWIKRNELREAEPGEAAAVVRPPDEVLKEEGRKALAGVPADERTAQLRKVNEELERANQMKSRIIANMSHELRTPLNSIIGFSNVLLERTFGSLTENQQRYIENINASGHYLLELINNMLDIAKIESGKFELILETVRVEDVVQNVIGTMHPLIDKKLSDFEIEIAEDVGEMTADVVKLKQILYNLVSNAVKFTPQDGKAGIKVIKKKVNAAEYVQFSVWDNGIGIAPEDRERIFLEFEQVDNSFVKKFGGAGLGLALTKKLVQIQAGDIWVDSKLGEGSTFNFTLPVISTVEGVSAQQPAEAISLDFPWMSEDAPLVLVVEDDISTAELLTIHLTQAGYRVSHAYNGEDAIQKAQKLNPFVITLDVMIPGKDGWEVLQELKGNPSTADIPVIIHSVIDNKDLAFALGATDYLLKPLDKDALLSKLEDISVSKGRASAPMTILIVENDEKEVARLKEVIGNEKILFYTAATGKRGLELAFALRPGLVILDFDLSDMQSFDFVRTLKDAHSTRDIPIFILSQKDLSVDERLALVGKIERIMKKQAFDTRGLIDHIKELEIFFPRKAGLVDEQTGLLNHRYFHLRLAQEVERSTRYKLPLILVMVDIDDFGHYIHEKGEHYATSVLKKVAELLRKNIRGSDVLVRYGGDAFAIILPNTVVSAGLSLSNRFNAIVKNYPFLFADIQPKGKITVSVGLTFLDGQSPEELILCTEQAMRKAIEKGGDRVEVYAKEALQNSPTP